VETQKVITATPQQDAILCQRLEALAANEKDFWSFKGNSNQDYGHVLFQYPAMMVPRITQTVLEQACAVHPNIERAGDPFSGSGTILTESMMQGLDFWGADINPLAILICQVKSGPFYIAELKEKSQAIMRRAKDDPCANVEASFPGLDKWFKKDVQVSLSKIRRAIRLEPSLWARKFFWVTIAETVRLTSNSRTSTFKLHIRKKQDIESRNLDPLDVFCASLERNLKHIEEQANRLSVLDRLDQGKYKKAVTIDYSDIRKINDQNQCDILITSPPYGDNVTTVPYGQTSYLPLQWVDLEDIGSSIDKECIRTTHEIDTRSLGGSRYVTESERNNIKERSTAFADYIGGLAGLPRDRTNRVTAFFRDLDHSLDPILKTLRKDGLMVWTLGNRNVGGKRVPLDGVLEDLLVNRGVKIMCKLDRKISSKRMAHKNSIADTMLKETILVMRKAN
jgi:site-specific DNA-methyltransferase (cytosine-N4-specific)